MHFFTCSCSLINAFFPLWLAFSVVLLFPTVSPTPLDGLALKTFIASADPRAQIVNQWHNDDPCTNSWPGVECLSGSVTGLVLDNMDLGGFIAQNSLSQLLQLRKLSLVGNSMTGSIPSDLTNCTQLKHLYLTNNRLTGPIPSPLSLRFKRIYVSNNMLSGGIPSTLTQIPGLVSLHLENNQLTGSIPAFTQPSLTDFNFSSNNLSGSIPVFFSKSPMNRFLGNADLCGTPAAPCVSPPPVSATPQVHDQSSGNVAAAPQDPQSSGNKTSNNKPKIQLTTGEIVGIVVGDAVFLLLLTLVFLCYHKRRSARNEDRNKASNRVAPEEAKEFQSSISLDEDDKPKLVFFEDHHTFRLEDLLRASAELLGNGSLGTAYKAVMDDGRLVTVKRLKELNSTGRKEFEQQMHLVGKLTHPNVVPLWAYYYAREEKLLVYEYQPNGNLLSLLHGVRTGASHNRHKNTLSWNARLRIARGVANGLAFLHHECVSQKIPHGNLKASNILIDENFEACIADFGLAPLLNPTIAAMRMVGYQAPEYNATKKISHKADVYSYGVLLLELLTGRMADYNINVYGSPERFNLPHWVSSVVREEWTGEVFDGSLVATNASEESLVTMLRLAMACVSESPEQRPRMSQVHKLITEIREDEVLITASSHNSVSMEGTPRKFRSLSAADQFTSSDASAIMTPASDL